jgi:hypothetical protein
MPKSSDVWAVLVGGHTVDSAKDDLDDMNPPQ